MSLPLNTKLEYGFITGFKTAQMGQKLADFAKTQDFDSLWVGDHISFPVPIMDCLAQLASICGVADGLTLGTGVYLLPLRHPTPVAKQVATIQSLSGNKLIFGVGVGGEFPNEYAACGVPLEERGPRLSESIQVLKNLWSGEMVSNEGSFYPFPRVKLSPPPEPAGGPPIWCGGRAQPALERCGRYGDGWISYVVSPDQYRAGLETISLASEGRKLEHFGTGHLLFARLADTYEAALDIATIALSDRYGMDFRSAAERYCALGRPEDVAEKVKQFIDAGVRHIVLDMVGPHEERLEQLTRFSQEVRPLISI
tara:strand:+ start:996 stop:1928 length:933 start_codon:yes stop_codon:yes gene_type:complete